MQRDLTEKAAVKSYERAINIIQYLTGYVATATMAYRTNTQLLHSTINTEPKLTHSITDLRTAYR